MSIETKDIENKKYYKVTEVCLPDDIDGRKIVSALEGAGFTLCKTSSLLLSTSWIVMKEINDLVCLDE